MSPDHFQDSVERLEIVAGKATSTGNDLKSRANEVRSAWPDATGTRIANASDRHGDDYLVRGTELMAAAGTIRPAIARLRSIKTEVETLVTAGQDVPGDVADDGKVTPKPVDPPPPASNPAEQDRLKAAYDAEVQRRKSLAETVTAALQAKLKEAEALDVQIANQLAAKFNLPPIKGATGPLDITPEGIRRAVVEHRQGIYGDCSLLAALIALGERDPSQLSRRLFWDEETGTYWVQFDDFWGNPKRVQVDPNKMGGKGYGSPPTAFTIFEDAALQDERYAKAFNPKGGSGITLQEGLELAGGDVGWFPNGWADIDDARKALESHPPHPVLAASRDDLAQPDNTPYDKRIVPNHAYAVVKVEGDTITLQNPHNTTGSTPQYITLTRQEYEKWFEAQTEAK